MNLAVLADDALSEEAVLAFCAVYTWRNGCRTLHSWIRGYTYRWEGDRIVHPLSQAETHHRMALTDITYGHLIQKWHKERVDA